MSSDRFEAEAGPKDSEHGSIPTSISRDELKTLRKTSKFTNFLTYHPCALLLLALLYVGLMTVWWLFGVNSEFQEGGGNFLALDEIEVKRFQAELRAAERTDTRTVPPLSQTDKAFEMSVIFKHKDGPGNNLFTPSGVLEIYDTEQQIRGVTNGIQFPRGVAIQDYDNWCQQRYSIDPVSGLPSGSAQGCLPPFSVVHDVFFNGQPNFTRTDVQALTQGQIDAALATFSGPDFLAQGFNFFFASDFPAQNQSWLTRSLFYFGVPINNRNADGSRQFLYYSEANDDKQKEKHTSWIGQYTAFFEGTNSPTLTLNYRDELLFESEIQEVINRDLTLAAVAGALVLVLMVAILGSPFLAICGMINILMAFPVATAIYHGIFQIVVNTTFNTLALYIALGIGADDVFVYVDAWLQSGLQPGLSDPKNLAQRVYWTWRRASLAMLVTTSTTFFAFLMTALSPIPAISTFGIMAGLLILCNYTLVITFFPACVMLRYLVGGEDPQFYRRYLCPCWKITEQSEADSPDGGVQMEERATVASLGGGVHTVAVGAKSNQVEPEQEDIEQPLSESHRHSLASARYNKDVDVSGYRWLERQFYQVVAPLVWKGRFGILAVFTIFFILASIGTAQLAPPDENEPFAPTDSSLFLYDDVANAWFPPSEASSENPELSLFWGINPNNPIDRSGLDDNDGENFGQLVLDQTFELNNITLRYIAETCEALKVAQEPGGLFFVQDGQVQCFATSFLNWELNEANLTLPLAYDPASVASRLQSFLRFENAQGEFPYEIFSRDLGGLAGITNPSRTEWVRIKATFPFGNDYRRSEAEFWLNTWQAKEAELNAGAPAQANGVFSASLVWADSVTFDILVATTYTSIFSSFGVAVAVVLIITTNWIVAAVTGITLIGIVLSSLAMLVVLDKSLGFVEAIVASILVGVAVDYCVHLANSFNDTQTQGRFYRARAAYLEMGVSVTAGMATTLSAAAVLLFTELNFFQLFGQFIFVAISMSYVWATTFFMALLMVIGPVGHPVGDIQFRKMWEWAQGKCKGQNAVQPKQ